ncbi:UDP-N-acetylglucosamine--LPS N-acetylglucosamine transferase [Jannaschia seohaensis]|uniref:Oligosaccharide biosynthesis protein Alg14 n=1 Tax=Jannaschia seohaensis TaxID=475081 RepID=A0A2Y9B8X7_9RHOB|nr:UDP-N-acetylglucosamine--LPS N-acetylglucosamine transferase [Jannaschia seohaensis]PWJ12881.1 oligosaccharide biosynthesis protein Alg14 [Jannaschia seohaensis]SSA50689.1 Oligosaccharide biosynthesis protein Alg14 like [Jannaschia seohaensis]
MTQRPRRRVLAVASAGGHWMQLMMLRPAWARHEVTWITTLEGLAEQAGLAPARLVPDCNRDTPLRALGCGALLLWHVLRLRPHAVVTTGALPGVLALAAGRLVGARTIWIDSVANAQEMSASGRLAARVATHRLSQWPEVARAEGAEYAGSVL